MTTQVAHSTIEHLMQVLPGQSVDWYIRIGQQIQDGKMPMPSLNIQTSPVKKIKVTPPPPAPVRPIVEKYCVQPQPPITTQPEKPKDVVSEATKAKLLALCKGPEMAEYYVAPERHWTNSEERAWQRAINKLTEEEDKMMQDKVKLYSNFGFYS